VECSIDDHMIRLRIEPRRARTAPPAGAFPWELPLKALKRFPVMLEYDERGSFVGLCIFRPVATRRRPASAGETQRSR
jgi:hypothetical protein